MYPRSSPTQAGGGKSEVAAAEPAPAKVCGVCGDRAKSHHFGGMACDSCKAFFRRSVQSEAYRHFRCTYDGQCHISISSRKCCQSCRFQKCLSIGMEKKWVMSEEERLHQDKLRKERKRQRQQVEESKKAHLVRQPSPHEARVNDRLLFMTDDEVREIDQLVETFYDSYKTTPLEPAPAGAGPPPPTRVVGVFVNAVSRLVGYITMLPRFREVQISDQKVLLKHAVLAILILRGTMVYDTSSSLFNVHGVGSKVGMQDLQTVLTPELYDNHQQFVKRMQSLGLNETTLLLLQMVVLFSSDITDLTDPDTIARIQDHYTCLTQRYMRWWYGEEKTRLLYPRMLHLLADLRTLTEAHNVNTVCFPESDLGDVVDKFKKIELNPYPAWPRFLEVMPDRQLPGAPGQHGAEQAGRTGCEAAPPPQRSISVPSGGEWAQHGVPAAAGAHGFSAGALSPHDMSASAPSPYSFSASRGAGPAAPEYGAVRPPPAACQGCGSDAGAAPHQCNQWRSDQSLLAEVVSQPVCISQSPLTTECLRPPRPGHLTPCLPHDFGLDAALDTLLAELEGRQQQEGSRRPDGWPPPLGPSQSAQRAAAGPAHTELCFATGRSGEPAAGPPGSLEGHHPHH